MNIVDFLPKYPIDDIDLYNDNHVGVLHSKKEFVELKLERVEDPPEGVGKLTKHQETIARFMSSKTMFDSILLFHEMGTGKTCSAVGAIEKIKNSTDNSFRGALILAPGTGLLDNFKNQLVYKCTDNEYIPDNIEDLTPLETTFRINKKIRSWYTLNTFEIFAKYIEKRTNEELKKKWSNIVIVIDEVHNIRQKSKETPKLNIYKQIHRFLHAVDNCKIILMSGTPMKDTIDEIASIMNLILPMNKQFNLTGKEFISTYFSTSNGYHTIKKEYIPFFKDMFRSRISYLRSMTSDVEKVFVGTKEGDLRYFIVDVDRMSKFQTDAYKKAVAEDTTGKGGVYSLSRQASLCVFPDGSYGPTGFNKYVKQSKQFTKQIKYSLSNKFSDLLRGSTDEEKLKNLEKYSSKYAASVRAILEARKTGKSVFVYSEFVKGSGSILFGLILNLFGFSKTSGSIRDNDKKERYAIISHQTESKRAQRAIMSRFNEPDNMNGEIIRVIIGSGVIREGFSLKNVQLEIIHTPHWNYSETSQALARGYRLNSHADLINAGQKDIKMFISQRVSIPLGKVESIDLKMYQTSEVKDVNMKQIERVIKESAMDCSLNYKRNYNPGNDGSRSCDYSTCSYKCDEDILYDAINYDTYNLYYSEGLVDSVIASIKKIFRINFMAHINYIKQKIKNTDEYILISALKKIIYDNVDITNKYGLVSYLREENNIYFLVDGIFSKDDILSCYYSEKPSIMDSTDFNNILNMYRTPAINNVIQAIYKNPPNIKELIDSLPINIKTSFIEGSIINNSNNNLIKTIKNLYKKYYTTLDGTIVQWYGYIYNKEKPRCYQNGKWDDCGEELESEVIDYINQKNREKEDQYSKYGYIGVINPITGSLCIKELNKDIRKSKSDKIDKRSINTGKQCTSWSRKIQNIMYIFRVYNGEYDNYDSFKNFKWNKYALDILKFSNNKYKNVKDLNDIIDKISLKDKRVLAYLSKLTNKQACQVFKQWIIENDMYIESLQCGRQDMKKL